MRGWKTAQPVGQRDEMGYENDDRAAGGDPVIGKSVHAWSAEQALDTTSPPIPQPPPPWQHLSGPLGRLVEDIARRSGFEGAPT